MFDPKPAWDPEIDVFKISPKMGSTVGPAETLNLINAFLAGRHFDEDFNEHGFVRTP
jgi:hypothetical protein